MPLKSFQCLLPAAYSAIRVHVDRGSNSSVSSVAGDGHKKQKFVKRLQIVCTARQQHVESTLKAQQLITCMSNILGFPTNLSALQSCSCRVFHLQTTSDAQNLLKMVVEASFWVHLLKGRLFFFLNPAMILLPIKKELLHSYHSMDLSGIPVCIL